MKSYLILVAILLLSVPAFSQEVKIDSDYPYGVIRDTDGYVNIRKSPSVKSDIVGKLHDGDIFSCLNTKGDWWEVSFISASSKSDWVEGYIHKSRVQVLSHWKSVKNESARPAIGIFKKDSLLVTVNRARFRKKDHKLKFDKDNDNLLLKIDGREYSGDDGEIPTYAITKVVVTINGKQVIVPDVAFNDLYEPNLTNIAITTVSGKQYVAMFNSDGAGAYTVIWIFKDGKYAGRYVDDSEA